MPGLDKNTIPSSWMLLKIKEKKTLKEHSKNLYLISKMEYMPI